MISIVLYGRNDSYGYNLHKRAALSLNCMAEVLTGADDEILFVDYNTPDDYPTFPEAIADTLTEQARRIIRIFRVRPELHQRLFATRTHLKAIEPVSRNVAVRRSNPANRWILSTNTDMIFVPRGDPSLTSLVAPLEGGFYCAPRMEIPETLWESFNRLDPAGVISETRELGETLHLNEIVLGSDDILYDAPGDFQLMRRSDLFKISGFNEDMLLGWHVDSNISRRLRLLHTRIDDAAPFVFGYHCDHTRQITPMHAPKSIENSITDFIDKVSSPELGSQSQVWGLNGIDLEEIRLDGAFSSAYRRALQGAIGKPMHSPIISKYRSESFDSEICPAEHVLPFAIDLFANARRDIRLGWVGEKDRLYDLFLASWVALGFTNPVVNWDAGDDGKGQPVAAFVVNFGMGAGSDAQSADAATARFLELVSAEWGHIARGGERRRIVAVNAVHNRFERLVQSYVGCGRTPFSARLRHGYLLEDALESVQSWTQEMLVGQSGIRKDGLICSTGETNHVFYGPYRHLLPGQYRIVLELTRTDARFAAGRVVVDVAFAQRSHKLTSAQLRNGLQTVAIDLSVTRDLSHLPVEVRLRASRGARVTLNSITAHRVGLA